MSSDRTFIDSPAESDTESKLESDTESKLEEEDPSEETLELLQAQERVIRKLINTRPYAVNDTVREYLPGFLDQDMFDIGTIEGKHLVVIKSLDLKIDLSLVIARALLDKKPDDLQLLLDNNVNFHSIEPKALIMCLETRFWGLMGELIRRKFPWFSELSHNSGNPRRCEEMPDGISRAPVDVENYRVIYQLAELGKLDILKLICHLHQNVATSNE